MKMFSPIRMITAVFFLIGAALGIGRGALRRADGVCCAGVCERAESLLLADVLQLRPADG